LNKLQRREANIVSKVKVLLKKKKYGNVVECTTSIIRDKKQFGEMRDLELAAYFNSHNIEIFHARAIAYLELKQHQSCINDANAGLELISAVFAQLGAGTESERWHQETRCTLLHLRAIASKNLGDKEGAFVDLRAVVALVHESGCDLDEEIQCDIMTLMAEMKLGCCRPHYTDDEIRAFNKEFQLKTYAPKNRICANCGKHHSTSVRLKTCGGCKLAWFCGPECLHAYWPTHKAQCKNPYKKKDTALPLDLTETCIIKKKIAEVGHYLVRGDNGPALVMHDNGTGRYYESLSDQDVFFVPKTVDLGVIQREVLYQRGLWEKEPLIAKRDEETPSKI
jgi:hypothetical protein